MKYFFINFFTTRKNKYKKILFFYKMSFKKIDINNITLKQNKTAWFLNKKIVFKTPKLYIPFGLEKNYDNYIIKLQLRNIKKDKKIKDFFDFIVNLEKKLSELLNTEIESQIIYNTKYDPLILSKLPQKQNQFTCNAFKDSDLINIFNIEKSVYCECELIVDSIWKFNNKFYYKLKINTIYL